MLTALPLVARVSVLPLLLMSRLLFSPYEVDRLVSAGAATVVFLRVRRGALTPQTARAARPLRARCRLQGIGRHTHINYAYT